MVEETETMKSIDELFAELPEGLEIEIGGEPYILTNLSHEWNHNPAVDRYHKVKLTFVHATEAVITESVSKFDF
jgi:hypothetical protein